MNNKSWMTEEDIERDLFEYSGLEYNPMFKPTPPKSIAEYRARTGNVNNGGEFDDNHTPQVFMSGRGKYVKDRIIKPGMPVESIPEDEMRLRKKIREVSGLGYRNEFIERAFAGNSRNELEEEENKQDFNISLKLHSNSRSSSNSPKKSKHSS